jgi:hypothetical protein
MGGRVTMIVIVLACDRGIREAGAYIQGRWWYVLHPLLCLSCQRDFFCGQSAGVSSSSFHVPAFGTLYQRLTLPKSTRYKAHLEVKQAQRDAEVADEVAKLNVKRSARRGALKEKPDTSTMDAPEPKS